MQLIRGYHNLRPEHRGCVATIGNFDGIHLGHQAVLGQLAEVADEWQLPAVVITFEPLPREYFLGERAPARLTRLREKLQSLRRFAVDRVFCLRFAAALARLPAETFIERLLVDGLGVRYLVVGDDFRFGHQRAGDFAMLHEAGQRHGFKTAHMRSFAIDGQRVSSSRVRTALAEGDMAGAARLLGRPYRISGRVGHGDRRGRQIGFPTANVRLQRRVSPVRGIFAVEVFGLEEEPLPGVANIGWRPTIGGDKEPILEVYLLDFTGNLYGRHIQVSLLHRLRDEERFASLDELTAQIAQDVAAARRFFDRRQLGGQATPEALTHDF